MDKPEIVSPTIDPNELHYYKTYSSLWWAEDSPFLGLKSMNQLRVPMVRDGLLETGLIKDGRENTGSPLQGLRILDVGCGGGYFAEEVAKLGCTVVGIDVCAEQIERAKQHAAMDPSLTNLSYRHESVERHAQANFEKYDAVIASEVLDHVNEPEMFMEECIKCLKPGGSIFVTTLNRTRASWLFMIVLLEYVLRILPRGTHHWHKFVTPDETVQMIEKHKCRKRSVRGTFYNLYNNNWYWSSIQQISYVVHAVKEH